MNERIRELALEAFQPINSVASEGVADYYTFEQTWFQLYNQKFAELIVRECVGLINEQLQHNNPNDSLLALKIKEHFGVEE